MITSILICVFSISAKNPAGVVKSVELSKSEIAQQNSISLNSIDAGLDNLRRLCAEKHGLKPDLSYVKQTSALNGAKTNGVKK